ncbi:P-loop containing nucleoside triphosphate hydrolases superfamily protein [Striga hermonthica]|uniref:P-loop containing nucleoside triphosphate hydrolases superfamily protein n=1 Tax=Striga hermonthica TaxID=68872 RepID=A0A9N7NDT7_STRHE|nr:P-loop containing nucleoside triphosphate hydrolases superfamily protein [Striga hermonthica]
MQRLLCRRPSFSGHLIPPINMPLSLPHSKPSFLSLGLSSGATARIIKMYSSAALPHPHPSRPRSTNPLPVAAPRGLGLGETRTPSCCCRPCGSSVEVGGSKPLIRAWVAPKVRSYDGLGGAHRAWYAAQAGNLEKEGGGLLTANEVEDDDENVRGKVQRRQRIAGGGGGAPLAVAASPDLLTIPGVGPRNLRKLVEKGFEGVAQLKQLYKDKFSGKSSEKMVEYLQSSVGIIHKNHAESITTFIKESVDEELQENDSRPVQKKRITLCVEGNISVGKTTFLQRIANETLELRDLVEVVPEPIDKWQNIGPDHFNILDAFYAEPERYAYTFQNYVFVTRVMQEKESSGGVKPLRLMERSVFSDRMVFVRAVHEAKWMNEMEISIYDSWFDPVVSSLPGLIPDGFIYLRASPDTCHKRMMLRKRAEEGGVSLDYLRDLHEKHESWLFPFQSGNHGVLSVSKLSSNVDWSLHPNIRDRVFYLNGDHMHSSIQKVPALVLDCEPDIDFSRDIDAKREYARQVAEFFQFVKKGKEEVPASDARQKGERSNEGQVILPPHGNLWLPGTQPFPDSALESLDFRRAMSSFVPQ